MIFRRRKKDPLKAMLFSLTATRKALSRIDSLASRIASRREYLLEKAFQLEERGNTFLAKKYIEEAERLKAFERRINYIKLVLEKLSLTLELNIEMRRFGENAKDILEVIDILKKLPEATIPDFALALTELEVGVREIAGSTASNNVEVLGDYKVSTSDEASRILEEAKLVAQQKLLGELSSPNS